MTDDLNLGQNAGADTTETGAMHETVAAVVTGAGGAAELVGQAARDRLQPLQAPQPNQKIVVPVQAGQQIPVAFNPADAQVSLENGNLHLKFANGGEITLENFAQANPQILFPDGTIVAGNVVVAQIGTAGEALNLETAAGPGATGGGGHTYNDDLGDVIGGIDAQDVLPPTELEFPSLEPTEEVLGAPEEPLPPTLLINEIGLAVDIDIPPLPGEEGEEVALAIEGAEGAWNFIELYNNADSATTALGGLTTLQIQNPDGDVFSIAFPTDITVPAHGTIVFYQSAYDPDSEDPTDTPIYVRVFDANGDVVGGFEMAGSAFWDLGSDTSYPIAVNLLFDEGSLDLFAANLEKADLLLSGAWNGSLIDPEDYGLQNIGSPETFNGLLGEGVHVFARVFDDSTDLGGNPIDTDTHNDWTITNDPTPGQGGGNGGGGGDVIGPDSNDLVNGLGGPAGFGAQIVESDDTSAEIAIPFGITIDGVTYNSIFIGSNGFVTFGSGDSDWTQSLSEFESGPPRIAAFWSDVDPANPAVGATPGGTSTGSNNVYYYVDGNTVIVTWDDVDDFGGEDTPNAFQIIIRDLGAGNVTVEIRYEGLTWGAGDYLAGITDGAGNTFLISDNGPLSDALAGTNVGINGVWQFGFINGVATDAGGPAGLNNLFSQNPWDFNDDMNPGQPNADSLAGQNVLSIDPESDLFNKGGLQEGHQGNDFLFGGLGDDTQFGGVDPNVTSPVTIAGQGWYFDPDQGTWIYDSAHYDNSNNDFLFGFGGDDSMNGQSGRDLMIGGSNSDIVELETAYIGWYGYFGGDAMDGGTGDDIMYGDYSDWYGGMGADTFGDDGVEGDDIMAGDALSLQTGWYYYGQTGAAAISYGGDGVEGGGNDYMEGNGGADAMSGDALAVFAYGIPTDGVEGGSIDTVYGAYARAYDGGWDTISGERGDDSIAGDAGAIMVDYNLGRILVSGEIDGLFFNGKGATAVADNGGNDQIDGGEGNNVIAGDALAVYISYGSGLQQVAEGGEGIQITHGAFAITYDGGDDTINAISYGTWEGPEGEIYSYENSGSNLIAGDSQADFADYGYWPDEAVFGWKGAGALAYAGNAFGAGDDDIFAGKGWDTIAGDAGAAAYNGAAVAETRNFANSGNDDLDAGEGSDRIAGESLAESNIIAYAGAVNIDAGEGPTGNDTIDAGDGDDTVAGEALAMAPVAYAYAWNSADAGNDLVYGGAGSDLISGDAAAVGETDADATAWYGGDDTIFGGKGDDTIAGDAAAVGGDADAVSYYGGNDSIVADGEDVVSGDALAIGDSAYAMSMIGGDDSISTDIDDDAAAGDALASGSNVLAVSYGGGNDTINAGLGQAVASGDALALGGNATAVSYGGGADTVLGWDGSDTLAGDAAAIGADATAVSYGGGADSIHGGQSGHEHASGDALAEGGSATATSYEGGDDTIVGDQPGFAGSDTMAGDAAAFGATATATSHDGGNDTI